MKWLRFLLRINNSWNFLITCRFPDREYTHLCVCYELNVIFLSASSTIQEKKKNSTSLMIMMNNIIYLDTAAISII